MNISQHTVAQWIWWTATAICLVLALIQAQRATTRKGDLLTTYLTDVMTLFLVFDVASTAKAIGFGALGAAVKAGATLFRASKEKS